MRGPANCLNPLAIETWALSGLIPWVRDWAYYYYPKDLGKGAWIENAMRHCLGQCILACKCGETIADLSSWWHERNETPDDPDHLADLHNNEWGKEFARSMHGCCGGCFEKCKWALNTRRLDTDGNDPDDLTGAK